ncbi:Putative odorant receptor [Apis cerana cerana]|uniref:Odorant receptor n=1 Tax=Apis cerana cerana TaxID=94128 RepID=A0A2A3ESQ0_APICC|nr:Putative odorant receptor [Apis cerana cerana]
MWTAESQASFLALTEKALQQVSFVEFLGCMLNICLLGYYVITEWSSSHLTSAITFFILLISLTFNIFIFCYIGELVTEQCKKVGEISYMVDWYRLEGNKKLCFVLIIAMSNSSIKLTAGNMVELCLTTFSDDDVRECVKRIEWDWKNISYSEDREIMLMNANFGKRLIIVTTTVTYSGFVFFYIAVPMKIGKIPAQDANISFIPTMFPFPKYIADVRYSPVNEIVFFAQFICGFLLHGVTSSVCSLAAILTVHACGQIQVMMVWLKHLINGRLDMCNSVDQRIATIVNQHVRILKFLALTEKALQQVSFVEFLGCMLDICLLGYYVIMEWSSGHLTSAITFFILLISLTFNIFIFCYIGELVAEQCKKVGEISYMVDWYRLEGNKKLCFVLIIAMSNSSIKLTAGNMVELCLTTFSDIVKTAVAFLNVLRTLT